MKKIYLYIISIFTVGIISLVPYTNVSAQLSACQVTQNNPNSSLCRDERSRGDYKKVIKNVTNLLLYLIGVASIFVIVVAGIRYITSANDSGRMAGAKSTLLYALVGLALSMVAYVIVNWVLGTVLGVL